jgi:hypothetical protein
LATISCPRCHQLVDSQAITCPNCRITLKAYGHPGIPLHRTQGEGYLCDSCTYDDDDTCNFPQRPYAKVCTLYENLAERKLELEQQRYKKRINTTVKDWLKRHQGLVLLFALLLICLAIALFRV